MHKASARLCRRLEALEEQQAALEKAVRDEPQPPERGTEPSSSPQPEALEGRLEELGELCRGLAARCDGLQGELSQLQSTAQSPSSGAEVHPTADSTRCRRASVLLSAHKLHADGCLTRQSLAGAGHGQGRAGCARSWPRS